MYRYRVCFSEPDALTKRYCDYFYSLKEMKEYFLISSHLKEKVVSIEKLGRFCHE